MHAIQDREAALSKPDVDRLRTLIYVQSGINLGSDKKIMLEQRLRPRQRALGLDSFKHYCDYVFSSAGLRDEMVHLLDAVTTNKTDFFREPQHFDYLTKQALPELLHGRATERPLVLWSAGCSTGEEPYTLAMVLSEYAKTCPGFRFKLLATDICTTVLEKANLAVFKSEVAAPVPKDLLRRYFLRSRDRASNLLRVVPELRNLVEFRQLNFKDADYCLTEKPDIIFCRNVIIYFDRQTQEQILQRLAHQLVPGGYAFLGHSETLHGLDVPLAAAGPAVYRKAGGTTDGIADARN
jgi:chemotaxis protein methyltransferase CheR